MENPLHAAPPATEQVLVERLRKLAGQPLAQIAHAHGLEVPADLRRSKGWVGQLLERALGATGASRAEPDFPQLGIELKTIPVDARGQPMESCFVASLDLGAVDRRWEVSAVRKKLDRVAWVAIEAARDLPLGARRCGAALLWSPAPDELAALRGDYEDLIDLLDAGARVTGHHGKVLQLRPKGANAAALRWALDEEGARVRTAPRAFYLRPAFTAALLQRHFTLPG